MDHAPLKISFSSRLDNKPHVFRFLNVWTSQSSLLDVIWSAWVVESKGSPLKVLCAKLLATRKAIQAWNKHVFGDIFEAVRAVEVFVSRAEVRLESKDSDEAQVELNQAQATIHHTFY